MFVVGDIAASDAADVGNSLVDLGSGSTDVSMRSEGNRLRARAPPLPTWVGQPLAEEEEEVA